jgi:hypothetical protein
MTDPAPQSPSSKLRVLLVLAAVLVPVIPILVGLSLSAGGPQAAAVTRTATATSPFSVASGTTTPKPATPNLLLPPGRGTLVALVAHPTTMRRSPGGAVLAKLPTKTSYGSPEALWVTRLRGAWLGVVSTLAGNNHIGWIPASATSLTRINWELKVSLAARQVTVLHSGNVVQRYRIAIGKPSAPTPTGHFAVTDRLVTGDPGGSYGCCILALSAQAPHAIQDWSGGNRIAIHSTPETDTIGEDVSHGCMRLTLAEGRWLLAHIPLGTPTVISG